jgi:hypothetical protein
MSWEWFGRIADILGVVGVGVSAYAAWKARSAAIAARDAREAALRSRSTDDLHECILRMEDLKSVHRAGKWEVALIRYDSICRSLLEIQVMYPELSRRYRTALGLGVDRIRKMEREVVMTVAAPTTLNAEALNAEISELIGELTSIHATIKRGAYGRKN